MFAGAFAKNPADSQALLKTDEFAHLTEAKALDFKGKMANQDVFTVRKGQTLPQQVACLDDAGMNHMSRAQKEDYTVKLTDNHFVRTCTKRAADSLALTTERTREQVVTVKTL